MHLEPQSQGENQGGKNKMIDNLILVKRDHMSRIVRKPDFCLGENKGADQLRGNREADQRLCFRYNFSASYIQNFKLLALFCDCTGRFVSDLVGNPEDRFSRVAAHIIS